MVETTLTYNSKHIWSDAHENILHNWKIKAFIDMWLQRESAAYYVSIDNVIAYPVILISSASGIAAFITDSFWSKYIIGISGIIVGIISSLGREIRASELCQQHSNIANRYSVLIRGIDTCLEMPRQMRSDPNLMIEKIGSEIDALSETQLTPPNYVINKFENLYGSIHQLMFGDNIVQIVCQDFNTRKMFNKMMEKAETSSGATSLLKDDSKHFV